MREGTDTERLVIVIYRCVWLRGRDNLQRDPDVINQHSLLPEPRMPKVFSCPAPAVAHGNHRVMHLSVHQDRRQNPLSKVAATDKRCPQISTPFTRLPCKV